MIFLIQIFATLSRTTRTANLDVFDGELIVVCQLFTTKNPTQSKDDDVFPAENVDDSRVAVGLQKQVRKLRSDYLFQLWSYIGALTR